MHNALVFRRSCDVDCGVPRGQSRVDCTGRDAPPSVNGIKAVMDRYDAGHRGANLVGRFRARAGISNPALDELDRLYLDEMQDSCHSVLRRLLDKTNSVYVGICSWVDQKDGPCLCDST